VFDKIIINVEEAERYLAYTKEDISLSKAKCQQKFAKVHTHPGQ
jgi:hypothetical protein